VLGHGWLVASDWLEDDGWLPLAGDSQRGQRGWLLLAGCSSAKGGYLRGEDV